MTSISQIPIDCQKTFSRFTYFLSFIGLSFFDEPGTRKTREYLRLLLLNVAFLPFMGVQIGLLFKINSKNFLEAVRCVPINVIFMLNVIKMTIAITKRVQIREVLVEIGNLWPKELQDNDEKAVILKNWLRQIACLVDSYFIFALSNLSLFEVIPLLTTFYNIYKGVDDYLFPFQLSESWQYDSIFIYLLTYIWEVAASGPIHLCLYLSFDLLIIVLTSDISLLFRLLQIDLEKSIKVSDDAEANGPLYIMDDKSYQRIIMIVVSHQKLLRVSNSVSDIFGIVIFIHIVFSSVMICFFGFLTVVYGGLADTIANLLSVFNSIITIFLLSLAGQLLCDTSNNITEAAYRSIWYESDDKVRNVIKLIMARAHRPSYLSALGFSNLTLRSFSKIMSTAWTYFTLLIQLYSEN